MVVCVIVLCINYRQYTKVPIASGCLEWWENWMEDDDRWGEGVRRRKERKCRESTSDSLIGDPELITKNHAKMYLRKLNLRST
jgi:hypothetical protein